MATRQPKSFDDLPDFFGVRELAALLNIGEARAYELTRRRGFPCMRLGGRTIRISKAGFEAWAQNNFGIENKCPRGGARRQARGWVSKCP
jgi:excisionase family DNA binding protein